MPRALAIIENMRDGAVNLLFPPECACCYAELEPDPRRFLCERCTVTVAPPGIARCPRCAMRFAPGLPHGADCQACRGEKQYYEAVWALGEYHDLLRKAVLRGKRPGGQILAGALTQLCFDRHTEALHSWRADLVVPTPLHWMRRFWRGANSPESMAELLSFELGIPCAPHGLQRRRFTQLQAGLPRRERKANVRGAFAASAKCDLQGARVLLVDDILTTGATLGEMAKTVRAAGAAAVAAVVLARAVGPG
jgi:ComF family protein